MDDGYSIGKRVKDVRPRDYGEGAIVGYENDGQEFWYIRWDDSGLDNEWLDRFDFELIPEVPPAINQVFFFQNGNVVVCDEQGKQVPALQGSWINYDYLRGLVKAITRSNPTVAGMERLPPIVTRAIMEYRKVEIKRECTCNDYPHHELCGAIQDYPDSEGKNDK